MTVAQDKAEFKGLRVPQVGRKKKYNGKKGGH
jgi:hypothetical protein